MSKPLLAVVLFLSIALLIRISLFYSQKTNYQDGQSVDFETIVSSEPKFPGNLQNFSVNLPSGERVFIETAGYPEYSYGQRVSIIGKLKIRLLNKKSSILSMNSPRISLVKIRENYFLAVINSIRQKIISSFQNALPQNPSALLLGIVFGIKVDFSRDFLANLKTVGVMHVIAASGMNVTMVAGFLFYLFSVFLKRQWAILLSIFGIVFYDFLAGFEPSIIRASIMAILAFSAQILGKQKDAVYILFLTGFIMLFYSPHFLTDIGFQLSFISTLGILIIPKLFQKWENGFTADLITTFSAQITTLPILVMNFGTYSLWSIVVNALVLWTVPVLMILGGLAAITSFIFEPLVKLLLYVCLPFLWYFEFAASFFANFRESFAFETIPWQMVAAYYLFLSSIITFVFKKRDD